MILLRKLQIGVGILVTGHLPWFVIVYCRLRIWQVPALISVFMIIVMFANFLLPYGLVYTETPIIRELILPWGEVVADLRVYDPSIWWHLWWLGIFTSFFFCVGVSWYSYRRTRKTGTLYLFAGMVSFLVCIIIQLAIDARRIEFTNMGEVGFIFLIFLMNYTLVDELKRVSDRLSIVLKCLPIAVYLKDTAGRYLLANNACERFLGHPASAIIGKSDDELLPEIRLAGRGSKDHPVPGEPLQRQYEETVDQGGRLHTYHVVNVPLLDRDGELYALCGVVSDLTLQREAEQQIHAAKQKLWHLDRVARTGMLASTLVHELSQPLAAVKNNAQAAKKLLARPVAAAEQIEPIIDDIQRDIVRAVTVTSGMRTFLRKRPQPDGDVRAVEVIREIVGIFKAEFLGRDVDLKMQFPPDAEDYVVKIGKSQLQQVLLNILMNSLDALDKGTSVKSVHLSMLAIGNRTLQIVISDTGIGIPEVCLGKVFEPFWTSKRDGMGLGLAICKEILEASGGEIRIQPNQGPGVSVILSLPLVYETLD